MATKRKAPEIPVHFGFDSLTCYLGKVNIRQETHGEAKVGAIDVPVAPVGTGDQWDEVLKRVMRVQDPSEEIMKLGTKLEGDALKLARAFANYKVNFRIGNKKIAVMPDSVIAHFTYLFATDRRDERIEFKVQMCGPKENQKAQDEFARDVVAPLFAHMGQIVRLELVPIQTDIDDEQPELELDGKKQTDPETQAKVERAKEKANKANTNKARGRAK